MKSYYQSLIELPRQDWDYYYEIDRDNAMQFPFGEVSSYDRFIYNFFERGGKVKIFKESDIDPDDLFRPNHICSVFFLGILLCNNTSLSEKYKTKRNLPGYKKFPFLWFLIALFHDNACRKEKDEELMGIQTVEDLKRVLKIDHDLLKLKFSGCPHLVASRENYFRYIRAERDSIEHGIAAGLLLYDRLVKIRRKKQKDEPPHERLFWDKSLEYDYRLAAQAISFHNIWVSNPTREAVYIKYGLKDLINPAKVKFSDFPLFYILAIADTIEPVKTFMNKHLDMYILENIHIDFRPDGITIENDAGSTLDFEDYITKVKDLENWLDIEFKTTPSGFELKFN